MPEYSGQAAPSDQASPLQPASLISAPASATTAPSPTSPFAIVGIGCSAGGLDALEAFFSQVDPQCGLAFVVVQHLDPDHVSHLPEILQRSCSLPVSEVNQHDVLQANRIYVIPPGKDLSLSLGALDLLAPFATRGLRLPIDFFFRSLATAMGANAIGVILSGMGSDGVQGMSAIHEKGGLTLAQLPASAHADSMPRSAIEAGIVDYIDLAEALPSYIMAHRKQLAANVGPHLLNVNASQDELEHIVNLLRNRTGHDFAHYKANTLNRRIERRLALHQLTSMAEYLLYLSNNPQELDLLFKELLIGVTHFFRDPLVWAFLQSIGLPTLLARHPAGKAFRAWVPACSTGEEAYSLAMCFKEVVEKLKPEGLFTLQIYATDLDTDAIDRARKGFFAAPIAEQMSEERLARFFTAEEGGYRISKEIREMVIFAPQNIISDPPFTKLDLISCRNLLIYFDSQLQHKLLPLFHYALNDGGLLVLGSSESIGGFSDLFMPLDQSSRIFLRLGQALRPSLFSFPAKISTSGMEHPTPSLLERGESLEQLTDQLIQQNYAPPAVLVNSTGDILYISGRTGKYLEPAAGKVNINIHAMAREGLREALTGVIRNALQQSQPIMLNGLQINSGEQINTVNVTVRAIEQPERLRGRVLIVFYDVPTPQNLAPLDGTATSGEQLLTLELAQTRAALHQTHAEMQSALEEYSVAYEVLQSTNEELQSTNEELTTSKEELQSLNEEMQTVNTELQATVDELRWVRNDMTNLLNSTEIATIFLDSQMKLRRFTTHATQLFKLIPRDVGRPLSDIVSELENCPELLNNAIEVLRSLVFQEKQVKTKDGHWYRVRIMPYRTLENVIDGVVITFIDIAEVKQLEAALRRQTLDA
ncbi:PAS domain-containing protein [Chitinibacter bivalviorum]|uniref:protein-glutamate O-methyltransferase n=1 Tax=Chitinibacter bivalviorum TaxID=2739434 RepID=A0A7H9BKZ5_9NEIS|nr:chemotaxis protein CheB [Chitinibacter bivalviorum]QLG89350.1 PAS domain-containing protein [Chitinibacter bivalviorum]